MAITVTVGNYTVIYPETNAAVDRDRFGTLINTILANLPSWLTTRLDDLNFADFELSRSYLKDTAEVYQSSLTISSGAVTFDLESGNHAGITLTENVTSITISNPPASGRLGYISLQITQDGTGGRTVTWPSSFKWAGGVAPTVSTAASARDTFVGKTVDGGTTWDMVVYGQGFA